MSTRKSLGFAFLDRYASLAIAVGSSMILARLLTPADMGLYAVTMALLALVATLRDMGAGQYLLQEKELTTERIRAVWGVQLFVGVALGGLVAVCSGPMTAFFGEKEMRDIFLVLALNYVINPFGSITYAWLMREMRYDAVAAIRFSATVVGAAASMWLALRGHGAISLAWGSLCSTITNAVTSTFFRPTQYPWLPGFLEVRRVLSFGTKVTSSSIVNTIGNGAPEFLLGKLQGLAEVGLYSRANGLVAMFARLVTDAAYSVAMSLFARESRNEQDSSSSFLKAVAYTTALSGSFAAGLIFLAYPVVRVLYGSQWDASVDATRILACSTVSVSLISVCSAALMGAGAVTKILKSSAATAVIGVVFSALGAWNGIAALATAMVSASILSSMIWLHAVRSVHGFSWTSLYVTIASSTAVAAATALGPLLSLLLFGARPEHFAMPLLTGTTIGIGGFLAGTRLTRHPLCDEFARISPAMQRLFKP